MAGETASMTINLQELLAGELAADIRTDGRAHSRFLQTLDRYLLNEYVATSPEDAAAIKSVTQAGNPSEFAAYNAGSAVPNPRPHAG